MKSRQLIRGFLMLFILSLGYGCANNRYVVVSPNVVMSTKSGIAHSVELDSTYQMYDHIRIKGKDKKEIVLISRADN